ncbi:MAG: prenyltransferase/squalene oxidase repeat-containing protein [Planctomycetota bacterium]
MKRPTTLALIAGLLTLAWAMPLPTTAYAQDEPAGPADQPTDEQAKDAGSADDIDVVFDEDGNILPRHFTAQTQATIEKGLAYLDSVQSNRGSFSNTRDGASYPVSMTALAGMAFIGGGNTTTRGPYADNVRKAMEYILSQAESRNDKIIAAGSENGRTMYPHGFGLMFLACVYGMENDPAVRERLKKVIDDGIVLVSQAQSPAGGWYYTPNSGDEGSVTVTQLQALKAASNAGFVVPQDTIDKAIRYLELCRTPEGGIYYSLSSRGNTRLPISAAALPCMYSAGDYDSEMAEACLAYVFREFCENGNNNRWNKQGGHDFYGHYYAAQAFYQAGNEYWDVYFPAAREQLIGMQSAEGSWNGDGIGPVYGTALALTILQLPYKYLPIYQR